MDNTSSTSIDKLKYQNQKKYTKNVLYKIIM